MKNNLSANQANFVIIAPHKRLRHHAIVPLEDIEMAYQSFSLQQFAWDFFVGGFIILKNGFGIFHD
jgi:hypothetical protein